jgi:predicted RNA-binding Zn ribbon-like protein
MMSDSVRMRVLLPVDVSRTLREVVPSHQRSRFVAQAVERELRRVQLDIALQASAGAWQDADYPELADGPAIDRWLAESRQQLDWDRQV